jgi:hypothetical protein
MDDPKRHAKDLTPKLVKALAIQQSVNLALLRGLIDVTKNLPLESQRSIGPTLQGAIDKAEEYGNLLTEISDEIKPN